MTNKKILLLLLVGMVFVLIFSGVVNSGVSYVKVDYNGNLFNWNSPSPTSSHDIEGPAYVTTNPYYLINCNEDSPGGVVGTFFWIVYQVPNGGTYGYSWYRAKCRATGHGVGNHFANLNPYGNNNNNYDDSDERVIQSKAYATCYDIDGDGYSSGIDPETYSITNVCGNAEPSSCDRDST